MTCDLHVIYIIINRTSRILMSSFLNLFIRTSYCYTIPCAFMCAHQLSPVGSSSTVTTSTLLKYIVNKSIKTLHIIKSIWGCDYTLGGDKDLMHGRFRPQLRLTIFGVSGSHLQIFNTLKFRLQLRPIILGKLIICLFGKCYDTFGNVDPKA